MKDQSRKLRSYQWDLDTVVLDNSLSPQTFFTFPLEDKLILTYQDTPYNNYIDFCYHVLNWQIRDVEFDIAEFESIELEDNEHVNGNVPFKIYRNVKFQLASVAMYERPA